MIDVTTFRISEGQSIYDISNTEDIISFDWSYKPSDDYIRLSESFYYQAQLIVNEIINNYEDNRKCDQWFFPALYLYRQAIELLCKGLLISVTPKKDITDKLTALKHRIADSFLEFYNTKTVLPLTSEETSWLNTYLQELESIDRNSNLFRYPIFESYLEKHKRDFLDIVDIANSIDQCYSIMFKCTAKEYNPSKYANDIDLTLKPKVLFFASHGIGNCMLYDSPWDKGYYRHIEGYSEIAFFLLNHCTKSHWSFLPIAFLIRHAIELSLKLILITNTEVNVSKKIQKNKIRKHRIYSDLWMSVKDMIIYYADETGNDLKMIDLADIYLHELEQLDTKGDRFRYPTDYTLHYHLGLKEIDFSHAINWMLSIFNFVNGCSALILAAYEYETDMKSEFY